MAARERTEAGERDPCLDALIAREVREAECWLKAAGKRSHVDLREEANRLHMGLTLGAFQGEQHGTSV